MRCASRALTRFYDLVLAPVGLRATQFIALEAIAERGEIAQWELAQEYGMAVETLSRRLAALRKAGLITMRSGTGHHGERRYRLTDAGVEMLRSAAPYWRRAQDRLSEAIADESSRQQALSLAERLTQAAKAAEELKVANIRPRS